MSDRITVVAIGEGESGKSTIIGRLLADLGGMDRRFVEKYMAAAEEDGKPHLRYAYLPMQLETERGLGRTQVSTVFELENVPNSINLIDTPGDPSYFKNFSTGTAKIDVALIVMDMERGVEETNRYGEISFRGRGGLREKCMVAHAMGAQRMIIVYNKMDSPKINYAKELYEEVREKMIDVVKRSGLGGVNGVDKAVHLPISAWEGANFEGPCEPLSWYEGPTLLEALSELSPPKRDAAISKPLRMSIDRSMRIPGVGTVLTGKVLSGSFANGDSLDVVSETPGERSFMVRSIESNHKILERAQAGDVVGIAAMGALKKHYKPGDVLVKRDDPKRPIQKLRATVVVIHAPYMIRPGYSPVLQIGHASVPCKVVEILNRQDMRSGVEVEEFPKGLKRGECGQMVIRPTKPICIECAANFNLLSRAILVDGNRVVAMGSVKEVDGTEGRRVILTKSAAKRA